MAAEATLPPLVQIPELNAFPFIRHGFSTRACGNMATRYGAPADVSRARVDFAGLVGVSSQRVAHYALTHSSRVGLVNETDAVAIDSTPYRISIRGLLIDAGPHDLQFTTTQGVVNQQGVDSLVATTPGVALFMVVGDSAPVMFIAPEGRAIAMAHVGIVGTVNHILEHTIEALCRIAECTPQQLTVGIGPTVRSCCYALGQSVTWGQIVSTRYYERFGPQGPGIVLRQGTYYFDLPTAIQAILQDNHIPATAIHDSNLCTACADSLFFSHAGGVAGRFGAILVK